MAPMGPLLTAGLSYDAFFTGRPSGGWALTPACGLRAVPGGDVSSIAAGPDLEHLLVVGAARPRAPLGPWQRTKSNAGLVAHAGALTDRGSIFQIAAQRSIARVDMKCSFVV